MQIHSEWMTGAIMQDLKECLLDIEGRFRSKAIPLLISACSATFCFVVASIIMLTISETWLRFMIIVFVLIGVTTALQWCLYLMLLHSAHTAKHLHRVLTTKN